MHVKRFLLKEYIVYAICYMLIILSFYNIFREYKSYQEYSYKKSLGILVVSNLYSFSSFSELERGLNNVKEYTTSDVFEKLSLANESHVIRAYYKFKASETNVHILNATDHSVVYSISNENIEPTRIFMFTFEVTDNLISNFEEYELQTGLDNVGGLSFD